MTVLLLNMLNKKIVESISSGTTVALSPHKLVTETVQHFSIFAVVVTLLTLELAPHVFNKIGSGACVWVDIVFAVIDCMS